MKDNFHGSGLARIMFMSIVTQDAHRRDDIDPIIPFTALLTPMSEDQKFPEVVLFLPVGWARHIASTIRKGKIAFNGCVLGHEEVLLCHSWASCAVGTALSLVYLLCL